MIKTVITCNMCGEEMHRLNLSGTDDVASHHPMLRRVLDIMVGEIGGVGSEVCFACDTVATGLLMDYFLPDNDKDVREIKS